MNQNSERTNLPAGFRVALFVGFALAAMVLGMVVQELVLGIGTAPADRPPFLLKAGVTVVALGIMGICFRSLWTQRRPSDWAMGVITALVLVLAFLLRYFPHRL